jgi:amino acid transporter
VNKLLLFPHRARYLGLILMVAGLIFAYLYFYGGRPEWFTVKVFAVASIYLDARYFVLAQTNLLDELAAILFIIGIAVFSFSKEKKENEKLNQLRFKALLNSLYLTIILWILVFLLIYGMAIFLISSLMIIFFLIIYNIVFRVLLFQKKRSLRHEQDKQC